MNRGDNIDKLYTVLLYIGIIKTINYSIIPKSERDEANLIKYSLLYRYSIV